MKVDPRAKALIFDCDGTLADSMPVHWQAWRDACSAFGVECPLEFLKELSGIPSKRIVQHVNERFNRKLDPDVVSEHKNELVKHKLHHVRPIEPVVEIVKMYKDKLPMAVASGGTRENVLNTIKAIGLEGCFKVCLTADDDIVPKPAPDIFIEAARILKVPIEFCQVFEDGDPGIEAAIKAGMIITDVRPFV